MWSNFFKPRLKTTAPIISADVAEKSEKPQSAGVTSKSLNSLTGGKIVSLTHILCFISVQPSQLQG